ELPAGLVFNASTGMISGTPVDVYAVTTHVIVVRDSTGAQVSQSFNLNVTPPPPLTANQLLSSQVLTVRVPSEFGLVAVSGGIAPYTFTIEPALPAGLVLNASTGRISGTPSAPSAMTNYTLTVNDSRGGRASRSFSLGVIQPLEITEQPHDAITSVGGI